MERTYRALYLLGITPWHSADIPAAIRDVVVGPAALPVGRAVDLGCGTGEQARYLAAHGWQVTAVDVVPRAVAAARRLDPNASVSWFVANIADFTETLAGERLVASIGLILDNGCLHGMNSAARLGWAGTVNALAVTGATLLVRAVPAGRKGWIGPAGINGDDITDLLGSSWRPSNATARSSEAVDWHHYTLVGAA